MTPKRLSFLIIGALVVITAGASVAYYFVSNSLIDRTSQLRKRLADEELASSKLVSLAQLDGQYQKLEPILAKIDQALPSSKRQSAVVMQLNRLAGSSGMSLPGVTFQAAATEMPSATSQTAKSGDLLVMPVTLSMSGSYDQMQTFLRNLEKLNRLNTVTSLSINRDKPKTVAFTITVNMYVKP